MLTEILEKLNNTNIDDQLKMDILYYIKDLLPLLNLDDINILHKLTINLIININERYNIKNNKFWTKNNGQDISSLTLTLIPYINNSNFDKITKLTDIIYKGPEKVISKKLLEFDRNTVLKTYFPYSNFALGLLNEKDDIILELYDKDEHIIYKCIENNFLSMLETIKITNGKLFVNWLNIYPLPNYKESNLYKQSIDEINQLSSLISGSAITDLNKFWSILNNNKGIWLGDYYNVLANGYYQSIKPVKWFLFCTKLNSKYYYALQYLDKILDLSTLFIYNDYNSLTNNEKNKFSFNIKQWSAKLENNLPIFIDIEWEFNLIKNLISFLVCNYSRRKIINRQILIDFHVIDIDQLREDTDEIQNINEITNDILLNSIKLLEPEHIWNYLKESIIIFQTSPYAKYLINDKINHDFFNIRDGINLKNIYNIAKSCSHITIKDKYTFMGSNLKTFLSIYIDSSQRLSSIYTERFFNFYTNSSLDWLNIKRNIALQENGPHNYVQIMNNMSTAWNAIKIDLIWDYLSENGLLSEFNLDQLDLTTQYVLDTNEQNRMIQSKLKTYLEQNKQYFNCNYFMTNKPYNELKHDSIKSYLEILTESMVFYTFYANDWISQLNFFNHYINHSILYITGSTGTGKSTQIPKLCLYALKMYDYKNAGKVICTQPRIPPTVDNAKRISIEMGLNIIDTIDNKEYKSNNYYIQYKHNKDSHIKTRTNHLTLKMVTDGTLLEESITSPLLKNRIMGKYEENEQSYFYDTENMYDIVIVDEAHEHNTNMDLILSLMRQTCIYNNSVRLLIVSATMDDDEPIYRSYYKLVNDNLVYPIKSPIMDRRLGDNFIESLYLDRRLHISVPKISYSYKITEYYDEEIEKLFLKNNLIKDTTFNAMKENSKLAQQRSYDVIKKICETTIKGDILLFSTGEEEIKQAVNELNKILPNSVIALPFYSRMHYKYRDIISNIHIAVSKIKNKKSNIVKEWADEYIEVDDIPAGTYKRVVIVATNVAEASITIESLKYVVDTGYSKVNRYDDNTDSSNLNIEFISESSRIQRKGRVGRVSDGFMYHIYGKNKRLNVKPKYGITITDFHTQFIRLSNIDINKVGFPLWEHELNPNLYNNFIKYNELIKDKKISKKNIVTYGIDNIITKQYLILGNPMPYYYYLYFNELNKDKLPNYLIRLEDGYSANQLIDKEGKLYIIHPFENSIKRNIMGDIIEDKKIEIHKWANSMLINVKNKLLYVPLEYNNARDFIFYSRTLLFDQINNVIKITTFEEKDASILLYASGYNVLYEMCQVITMIKAINNNILSIMLQDGKFTKYDENINIFGSDSDITSIYNITKVLKNNLSDLYIYSIYSKPHILEQFRNEYNIILKEYRSKNYNNIKDSLNIMNALYHNGRLDSNKGFLTWLKSSTTFRKKLSTNIYNNRSKIKTLCEQFYLNYNTVLIFYNLLIDNIIKILTADLEFDESYNLVNPFKWAEKIKPNLMKIVTTNTIEEKLNLCFFLTQPLYFSVLFNDKYINMSTKECNIKPFIQDKYNTLCSSIGSYIGYYSYSNNFMSIIYNIDPSKISFIHPIYYNPSNIKNIYYYNREIKQYSSKAWDKLIYNVNNSFSLLSFERFPLNTNEFPVIQEFIKQYKNNKKDDRK